MTHNETIQREMIQYHENRLKDPNFELSDYDHSEREIRRLLGEMVSGMVKGAIKFELAITFELVTPESCEVGDFEETGYEVETHIGTLEDIVDYVYSYGPFDESACYPVCPHCWFMNVDCVQDRDYWEKGYRKSYSIHIKNEKGKDLTQTEIEFIQKVVADKIRFDF